MYVCRVEWIYWFQGMVILAANQVWWTWEVEDTFMKVKKGDKMGLKNYSRKLHAQINEVVVKVCQFSHSYFKNSFKSSFTFQHDFSI